MRYSLFCLHFACLLRCIAHELLDLLEQFWLLVEHRRQALSELRRICCIAWIDVRLLYCRERRFQSRVGKLHCFQSGRRELDFAFARLVKQLFDSAGGVDIALFRSARSSVFHAFNAGHAGSECGEKVVHAGEVYALSPLSVRRWNVRAAPQ